MLLICQYYGETEILYYNDVDGCHLSFSVLNLQTVALSLLLVFRTNAAYGRWDEARKMQGLLLNRSRDLTRQVLGRLLEGFSTA